MKKLLLASAVAALSISAQAAPTVYGKAFLSLDHYEDERTKLNSNGSRIGFKGSESVGANTDVVYQLEYGVRVDDGSANFTSRDTYIGVANKQFGTVVAGRLRAIDGRVDYANVTAGGVLGDDKVQATFDGSRANNVFAYISPNLGNSGVTISSMYVMDESGKDNVLVTDLLGRDAFGVAVQYEPKDAPFKAGASYIQAGATKIARVSGAFDIGQNVTIGALYQDGKATKGGQKEKALTVSGEFKTGTPWTAYTQVDLVDNAGYVKDAERKRLAVGGKYGFSKTVTGHVYAAGLDRTNFEKQYGIGGGIEYKF